MSTSHHVDPQTRFPIWDDDFANYFLDGAKPRSRWRVGVEFEKFAIEPSTGRAITYDEPGGLKTLLQTLADNYGWVPHYENGNLTTLSRDGATVSLEPGGQVEFSTSAVETIHEVSQQFKKHTEELKQAAPGWLFVAAGVHPFQSVEQIPLGKRPRHRIMAEYLPPRAPQALAMMKATASTQATFDYDSEQDAIRKFTIALKLAPIINTLWANSSWVAGKPSSYHSARAAVWHGMDSDRSGLLLPLLSEGISFANWTKYLLDVPRLFHHSQGKYESANGATFRDWLRKGVHGKHPTLADWEMHLTTVFPEARLKHFLEVRGADAGPPRLALAVPAFWKGLFYDEVTLNDALRLSEELTVNRLAFLWETIPTAGPNIEINGRSFWEWAEDIVGLATQGLKAQGHQEENFLTPIWDLVKQRTTPSLQTQHLSRDKFLKWNSY